MSSLSNPLPLEARIYAESPTGPRIFLAEDDTDLRNLFLQALRRNGFEVLPAGDGGQLLAFLSAVAAKTLPAPDAIIMDVRMPCHSGMDLLVALRLAEWDVPILLMTAFADDHLRARALALGAERVMDKPLSGETMVEELRRALRGHAQH